MKQWKRSGSNTVLLHDDHSMSAALQHGLPSRAISGVSDLHYLMDYY